MNPISLSASQLNPDIQSYSWSGVLAFLTQQCQTIEIEKTQWMIEKKQLSDKITQLEAEIRSQENINTDLLKRIKMLEFSLRQERIKYAKLSTGHQRMNSDVINNILSRVEKSLEPGQFLPKRRTRAHRQMLSKYLQELGLDDIFSTEMPTKPSIHHRPTKSFGSSVMQSAFPQTDQEPEIRLPSRVHEPIRVSDERPARKNWEVKHTLKSHFDAVRTIEYKDNILITAGEDLIIKLWDLSGLESSNDRSFEPYLNLRGHTGTVFSLACSNAPDSLIYSAGADGVVRVWDLPASKDVEMYGNNTDRFMNIGIWRGHNNVVWDLQHHPNDNLLLSVSADDTVKLWRTVDSSTCLEQYRNGIHGANAIRTYEFSQGDDVNTPTCCTWVKGDSNTFIVGYTSPYLNIYDRHTGKPTIVKFIKDSVTPNFTYQINKLVTTNQNLVISAHEDKHMRFFDLNSCKVYARHLHKGDRGPH
jgi:striatin 1/3/4